MINIFISILKNKMITKIIAIGDPHFKSDNIPEIELFIQKIIDIVHEKKPDLIILLGDILDTFEKINIYPLNKACEFINKLRKISKTIVLVGNHDMGSLSFLTKNHWLNPLKEWENTVIVDEVIIEKINGENFIFAPFVPNGMFEKALNTIGDTWEHSSMIFCHQEFYGCSMGSIISVEGDKWSLNNPPIISGHIHNKQKPQENIFYVGSSTQTSFGEDGNKIIAYIEFENKNHKIEEIELILPKKKILHMDIDEVANFNYEDESENKIKVSISGIYEEFKTFKKTKKYKDMLDKGIKVVFKPKRIETKLKNQAIQDNINSNKDSNNFKEILETMIEKQENPWVKEVFELVINNREIFILK